MLQFFLNLDFFRSPRTIQLADLVRHSCTFVYEYNNQYSISKKEVTSVFEAQLFAAINETMQFSLDVFLAIYDQRMVAMFRLYHFNWKTNLTRAEQKKSAE